MSTGFAEKNKPSRKRQTQIILNSLHSRMIDFKRFDSDSKRAALNILMCEVKEGKL